MKKKSVWIVLLLLCVCIVFASCNTPTTTPPKKDAVALAAPKIDAPRTPPQGYEEFADKLQMFAAKLTTELCAENDGKTNVCISPISVYMALAMACECSDGDTRQQILDTVGVTYEEVSNFTKYLYAYCNNEFLTNNENGKKETMGLEELVNSIWADDNHVELKEACAQNLAENFNCDSFVTDFDSGAGKKAINKYIEEKTHGLIDGNVDIKPDTLIVLMNTLYLKEVWDSHGEELSFDDNETRFAQADGTTVLKKLLQGYYCFGQAFESETYRSFFTTTGHGFRIKFIVPTDGHTLKEVFTAENIYNVSSMKDYRGADDENQVHHYTRTLFPEYKAEFDGEIKKQLTQMGIKDLFARGRCDFSPLTDTRVFCTSVIHKSKLKVEAKGIEGAAVTIIQMAPESAGPGYEYQRVYHDFVVDRAFGFVLMDSYGSVLFSGIVNSL